MSPSTVRLPVRSAVSALLLASSAYCVQSQAASSDPIEALGPLDLEQIVVTATRLPMRAFDIPMLTHALTADEVQALFQSRSLPEALGEVPGVLVQKTSNGQGSPFLRGFTGFRNVLLVDGIRLNNSVFRDGPNQYWNTVDVFSMSRVEVLKGPASVLYGSDAIGGAVNVLTDVPGTSAEGLSSRVLYRYADAESSQTARAEATYRGEALRAKAGYTYKDYDDVEAGGNTGEQPRTGYDEQNVDARLEYDIGEHTTLALGYQYVDQDDVWRTHRTIYGISWKGTAVGTDRELTFDQGRQLGYLQVRHDDVGVIADTVRASVSYHEQTEDQYRVRSNLRYDELGFDVGTTGLWVQFDKKWGLAQLVYGADYYRDDVSSYNVEYNANSTVRREHVQGPVADDATYDLAGIFLQAMFDVSPRFGATLAGRYTYASVDARQVEDPITFASSSIEDSWDNFSASGRLSFTPVVDGPWMLFTGVAQAFRAPNLSDLTRLDTARSGELETPSPGLTPETFVSWEAGVKFAGPKVTAQAAYFRTDGSDVIIRSPTGRIINGAAEVTKKNASNSQVDGIEAQVTYQLLPQVLLFADGMVIDGEADAYPAANSPKVREPIDLLMPTSWRLGARWTALSSRLRLEALVEHADEQDQLSSRDLADTQRIPPGGTPGYTVLGIRSEWRASPHLTLSLAVDNLTDEDYRIHGSGFNEPGRNVIMSLAVTL
jgi:hemoglobin/transferrin/lactoferrin receptor protein